MANKNVNRRLRDLEKAQRGTAEYLMGGGGPLQAQKGGALPDLKALSPEGKVQYAGLCLMTGRRAEDVAADLGVCLSHAYRLFDKGRVDLARSGLDKGLLRVALSEAGVRIKERYMEQLDSMSDADVRDSFKAVLATLGRASYSEGHSGQGGPVVAVSNTLVVPDSAFQGKGVGENSRKIHDIDPLNASGEQPDTDTDTDGPGEAVQ